MLKGIYLERDIYEKGEFNPSDIFALGLLGIKVERIGKGKLKILEDTSEQNHELCDDEDALALVKSRRGRFCP